MLLQEKLVSGGLQKEKCDRRDRNDHCEPRRIEKFINTYINQIFLSLSPYIFIYV